MKTDVTDVESSKQHSRVPLLGQEIGKKKEHVKYCSFFCKLFTKTLWKFVLLLQELED